MMTMKTELSMFLVSPVGYEHLATVVVAEDREDAVERMLSHPAMEGLGLVDVIAINLNDYFYQSGYEITVSRVKDKGVYH